MEMKTALAIAGSDGSGGAGIQADIKTLQAHGVFAMSAVTAVTVQDSNRVYRVEDIRPDVVYEQITRLFDDFTIDAVKIGMISNARIAKAVCRALDPHKGIPVVYDPVMASSSGHSLLDVQNKRVVVESIFPLTLVVTPNIPEAEILTGLTITSIDDMKKAAAALVEKGARYAIVKGGHLEGDRAVDIISNGKDFKVLSSEKIVTRNTHGTGCTFSSALAANLALGHDVYAAAEHSKQYITGAIQYALDMGSGHGPLNHFYRFFKE